MLIDINKACEWIANMPTEYSEFIEKGHCQWISDDFCKAMGAVIKENLTTEYDAEYLQSKIDAFTEARRKDGKTADEMLDDCRGGALELTWQDVKRLWEVGMDVADYNSYHNIPIEDEAFYREVLKRYKEESK